MRVITRNACPTSFTDWLGLASDEWSPSWASFQNPQKSDVVKALLVGQRSICCYCECRISSSDCHIEHLMPRSKDDDGILDYNNFAASCLKETEKGQPLTCGKARGNWNEDGKYLNPYDDASAGKVTFEISGRIDEQKNPDFIKNLNLNSKLKVKARLAAASVFDGLEAEEVETLMHGMLEEDNLPQFMTFLSYFAQDIYDISP